MFLILSWTVETNLVYLRVFLVGSMSVVVSWVIVNKLVYFRSILVYDYDSLLVISTVVRNKVCWKIILAAV